MISKRNIGPFFLGLNSIIYILLAAFNFLFPLADFVLHMMVLAIGIMLSGLICMTAFLTNKRAFFRPGWLLSQALILIIFGFFILYNRLITDYDTYYILFGSIGLFTGIVQISSSLQIKALDIKKWYMIGLVGLMNLFLGLMMMMKFFIAHDLLTAYISVFFLFLSMSYIVEIFIYRKSGV